MSNKTNPCDPFINIMEQRWSKVMQLIEAVGFSQEWIVEIFPPAEKVVDNAEVRHFWIIPEPDFGYK